MTVSHFLILPTRSFKLLTLSLLCGAIMVGCGKKDNQDNDTPAEPPTAQVIPNCDDASIKNALVRTLAGQIDNQINGLVGGYANSDDIDLSRRTQQRLSELNIDLQNARVNDDSCSIDIIAPLPATDIMYADRYFASQNLASVAERARTLGIDLASDNRLVIPVKYRIDNGSVSLIDQAPALTLIAETMTASAYAMAQGENRINTNARPAITVTPLEPIQITRPEPTTPESTTTPPSQDPLAAEYDRQNNISGNTNTNNQGGSQTNNQGNSQASNQSGSNSDVDIGTAPQGDSEITIVELDETYD